MLKRVSSRKRKNYSPVTPEEFGELLKSQQELKALEATKLSSKKAKKNPWLSKQVWSSKIFPAQEPRIYFNKGLTLVYMC